MMAGRRAPIIAGVVMAVVVVLAFLLVVSPKRAEVGKAEVALGAAQTEELTLVAQKASLEQAKAEAPANRRIIRQVEQQLPPTADPQGFILLLEHASEQAGVDLSTESIGNPTVADVTTGITVIPITVSLTGTYFSLTEYLFQLETLPRAAKVISVSLAPGTTGGTTVTGTLTLQVTMELYTTDLSAGPGSVPGPTETTPTG
jgi:Tfp pilus assembly protein PilO